MKAEKQFTAVMAGLLLAAVSLRAELPNTYQVTGPVLEVTDSKIVVQKGDDKWELARDRATRLNGGAPKVGDKVTIEYRMIATRIDVKSDKAGAAKGTPAPGTPARPKP